MVSKYTVYHPELGEQEKVFAEFEVLKARGIQEITVNEALRIVNLWNQGAHHDYRYWIKT